MSATIPTIQYGNIQPTFENEGDTFEEAMELGLQRLKTVWDRTASQPLEINRSHAPRLSVQQKILRCWASGVEVFFDPINHVYFDASGKKWLGGSTFASRYCSEFKGELIAGKMANKHNVDADEILAMWELNAEASATFGTSVHLALQLRGEYGDLSKAVKDGSFESALTSNPVLRPIVEKFFETREHEEAKYEVFVADPNRRHCGLIDRLVIEDDGLWVEDFKTNASVTKSETILEPFKGVVPNTKLGAYWLQLSFYARILAVHGKTVKGLRLHHWTDGRWETYENPVIDLSPAAKESK